MSDRARDGDRLATLGLHKGATLDEVREAFDRLIAELGDVELRGFEVSNSIWQRGIGHDYRGVRIAPADDLYPQVSVRAVVKGNG